MLKKPTPQQTQLEMVTLESLVPAEHLLRKIERAIDFGFIHGRVAHLYCEDNGRPALDPTVMFKALLIGYLFGIRSERRLVAEIRVNVAYRWFLGLRLSEKVFDASTLSQNRRRRFARSTIYQEIFDEIVLQAMAAGLVDGSVLYSDSTHIKASANKNKWDLQRVEQEPLDYLAELERAVDEDRQARGRKPLKRAAQTPQAREKKISRTDPGSGYMVREGKPKGFFYLDHRTVDGKCAIITDTHVSPASVHDARPYLRRLDRQRERFGFSVEAVGLDAGYFTAALCHGLEARNIEGVIGYRRPTHKKGYLRKNRFQYDPVGDCYHCPGGERLDYSTTGRSGYREYKSDPRTCRRCPLLARCTRSANHTKVLTRHVWEQSKERVSERRLSPRGKELYARRKQTIERSFADAKELHGQRYARMRGIERVREQCLLSAAAQNIKKIALSLARRALSGLRRLPAFPRPRAPIARPRAHPAIP